MSKHTHIVRCVSDKDPYLTKGKEYRCWFDTDYHSDTYGVDACGITDDDGDANYFMFPDEYIVVRELNEDEK